MKNLIAFSVVLWLYYSWFWLYFEAAKGNMKPNGQMIKITTRLAIINFSIIFAVCLVCLLRS